MTIEGENIVNNGTTKTSNVYICEMIARLRSETSNAASSIEKFAKQIEKIQGNESYSAAYKDDQITKERENLNQHLDAAFGEDGAMASRIQAAVSTAKDRAALPAITPAEEQLIAVTASQDIEARQSNEKAMFDLYQQTQESGDRTRAKHLARLIEPRIEGPDFKALRMALRTPEESERDKTLAAASSIKSQLPMVRAHLDNFVEAAMTGEPVDQSGLGRVVDQVAGNVERSAASPSAGIENT
ncbi:MAG: hypothetical protein M0Z32_04900 [Actinomycetota bacterium]|jgi:ribosomal protein L18|nr:hypothetical protein [Actinomycetota bacterium]MCL6094166.1 hypothetical protein [Actinomycetota bacterium]MDA8167077.1 hypothetical protein [Actinomycetota bacterium]